MKSSLKYLTEVEWFLRGKIRLYFGIGKKKQEMKVIVISVRFPYSDGVEKLQ